MVPQFTALQDLNVHCVESVGSACSSRQTTEKHSIGLEILIVLTVSFPIWMSGLRLVLGSSYRLGKQYLVYPDFLPLPIVSWSGCFLSCFLAVQ